MSKNIYVILGPTSTGKTSLALDLCEKFDGEIISADSRQVVKYMDIGTGKAPIGKNIKVEKNENFWKLDGRNVWGYDLFSPADYFSGYDFAKFGLKKARELAKKGKTVFLVGGTGFYIDLFTGRSKPSSKKPDFDLRNELEKLDLPQLQEKLMSLNKDDYLQVDKNNPTRLIRAIEKHLSQKKADPLPYLTDVKYIYWGLKAKNQFLYSKADNWLEKIWDEGLVDEVKKLLDMGFGTSPKLKGLIYKSVVSFLGNELSEEEAKQRAKYDLHAYIRRQLTYFKKNKEITWFDISKNNLSELTKLLEDKIA